MAFRIYTKTGDRGRTALIGGVKVSKADLRIESYGTVDELNAYVGLCRDVITDEPVRDVLYNIQNKLFVIGAQLACDPDKNLKIEIPALEEEEVTLLEKEIDRMDDALEPMKNFILPGGHIYISYLHIARTVCRRAERVSVALSDHSVVNPLIIVYLNRLSDYLFVLARYTGLQYGVAELPWKK